MCFQFLRLVRWLYSGHMGQGRRSCNQLPTVRYVSVYNVCMYVDCYSQTWVIATARLGWQAGTCVCEWRELERRQEHLAKQEYIVFVCVCASVCECEGRGGPHGRQAGTCVSEGAGARKTEFVCARGGEAGTPRAASWHVYVRGGEAGKVDVRELHVQTCMRRARELLCEVCARATC